MAKTITMLLVWIIIWMVGASISGCASLTTNPPPPDLGRDALIFNGVLDLIDLLSGTGD